MGNNRRTRKKGKTHASLEERKTTSTFIEVIYPKGKKKKQGCSKEKYFIWIFRSRERIFSFCFSQKKMSKDHSNEDIGESLFLKNARKDKELEHGEQFAFCGMQGFRKSNEDFHKHSIPFDNQSWKLWSFFAIFDGHNGQKHFFFVSRSMLFVCLFLKEFPQLKMLQIFLFNIYLKHSMENLEFLRRKQFIHRILIRNNLKV